jgi:lipopolysaccharide export LptBFGC system permease protein LptF
MIPLDPKKAQKLGEEWGKVAADSVFGVVDVVSKHNAKKAANKGVMEHNHKVAQQTKILKDMAIKELEKEQEQDMLARMSPSQREAYRKAQQSAIKHEKEEAQERAERNAILQLTLGLFVGLPLVVYVFLFILVAIFAGTDRSSYRQLSPLVPGSQAIFGKY